MVHGMCTKDWVLNWRREEHGLHASMPVTPGEHTGSEAMGLTKHRVLCSCTGPVRF